VAITLQQFEQIDGLLNAVRAFGDIDALVLNGATAEVSAYIHTSNRLFDACIDAIGYDAADAFPCAEDCAADIIVRGLTSSTYVVDEVSA